MTALEAASALVALGDSYIPDDRRAQTYDALFEVYLDAIAAQESLTQRLRDLATG